MGKSNLKFGQKLSFLVCGMRLEGTYLDDAFHYTKDMNSNVVNIKVTFDESNVSAVGSTTRVDLSFIIKV